MFVSFLTTSIFKNVMKYNHDFLTTHSSENKPFFIFYFSHTKYGMASVTAISFAFLRCSNESLTNLNVEQICLSLLKSKQLWPMPICICH